MKKVLFLIISIFLLTGCSATYEMNINTNKTLNEKLNITIGEREFKNIYLPNMYFNRDYIERYDCSKLTDDECKEALFNDDPSSYFISYAQEYMIKNYGFKSYAEVTKFNNDKNMIYDNKNNNFTLSYQDKVSFDNIDTSILSKISENYSLQIEGNKLILNATNINAKNLENAKIIINSPYKIESTNAIVTESDSFATCTWNVYNNTNINLVLNLDEEINKENTKKSRFAIIFIIVTIILTISIATINLIKKSKHKDKI